MAVRRAGRATRHDDGGRARLVLEDGTVYEGRSFGARLPAAGEVVFTTGMVGYPEALTDPSYHGQILTFTYPTIGNYGVPRAVPTDAGLPGRPWESGRIHAKGVVVATYSDEFSHHSAGRSLGAWLEEQGIPGISGIDTRALTTRIRVRGAMLGRIELQGRPAPSLDDPNLRNLVAEVSTTAVERHGRGTPIVLVDCGKKNNQVRMLVERGAEVRVVPWDHPLEARPRDYAGVLVSNGPGDPRLAGTTIDTVRRLMHHRVPVLGICLGHQILALAAGASTFKMKFGHRSHNQPCVDQRTGRCYQTSQNHGFAVDGSTLPDGWRAWFVNANDGTNEGIRHARLPFRSAQFHPEAAPGPGGTEWILDEFLAEVRR